MMYVRIAIWPIGLAAIALSMFSAYGIVAAAGDTLGVAPPTTAPAAPKNLEARVVHDRLQITLLWEDNANDEDSFVLARSVAGADGPWTVFATLPADSTQHDDTGLENNVTYWYRVAATNAAGMSDYSNVAFGTADTLPMPPVGDANCDGAVTSVDAVLILQFSAALLTSLACAEFADANENSVIDAIDAALVLQFVAGLVDSLPPAPGM